MKQHDINMKCNVFEIGFTVSLTFLVKGTILTSFFLYFWSDHNKKLWTHVKSRNKWGNSRVLLPAYFLENESFTENWKKIVRGK